MKTVTKEYLFFEQNGATVLKFSLLGGLFLITIAILIALNQIFQFFPDTGTTVKDAVIVYFSAFVIALSGCLLLVLSQAFSSSKQFGEKLFSNEELISGPLYWTVSIAFLVLVIFSAREAFTSSGFELLFSILLAVCGVIFFLIFGFLGYTQIDDDFKRYFQ